ncbi:MAG TPA: hypothetical protein VF030_05105 [Solirubrobacterales bacterium]
MQFQVLEVRVRRRAKSLAGPVVLLAACALASFAHGERVQKGTLIVSLDGRFSPLALPRDRPAPVSVHLDTSLQTSDGSILPRVTRVELGIPQQAVITTRGLPTCSLRRLRDATREKALEACRPALIGRGRMLAQVKIPHQESFGVRASLLAFNGRFGDQRAVIVHGVATRPPTSVVLPFLFRLRPGRFGTVLVAHLPATLGPWPRFARFQIDLSRRYHHRGRELSYISATCPIPKSNTGGFASLAKATFTLAGGRQLSTEIVRSCRARG